MIKHFFHILMFIISPLTVAQNIWDATCIPDSLRRNANSVIRKYSSEFTYSSAGNGEDSRMKIVTVLNDKGNEAADFNCYCDKFTELKSFSGKIYNSEGKLIRKLKKTELTYTDYSEGSASDDYLYYLKLDPSFYPYTVQYEWKTKYTNGIMGFPVFLPQTQYCQSVQEATYRLNLPTDTAFNFHVSRMENAPLKKTINKNTLYEWGVHNLSALEKEDFGPTLYDLTPSLLAVPVYFY